MNAHSDRTISKAARISASAILALSGLATTAAGALAGQPGSIWTTTIACDAPAPQNANHYSVGDEIYIRGANFAGSTALTYTIAGQPGHASGDPGATVASGTGSTDSHGSFCIDAYTIAGDDWGEYKATVNQGKTKKSDNYNVDKASTDDTDNTGDTAGDETDDTDNTGDTAGDETDNTDNTGDTAGDETDNTDNTGDTAGDETDNTDNTGDTAGDETDNTDNTGDTAGDETDNTDNTGDTAGDETDNTDNTGDTAGDETDNTDNTGDTAGDETDNTDPTQDVLGTTDGDNSGPTQDILGTTDVGSNIELPATDTLTGTGPSSSYLMLAGLGLLVCAGVLFAPSRRRASDDVA